MFQRRMSHTRSMENTLTIAGEGEEGENSPNHRPTIDEGGERRSRPTTSPPSPPPSPPLGLTTWVEEGGQEKEGLREVTRKDTGPPLLFPLF